MSYRNINVEGKKYVKIVGIDTNDIWTRNKQEIGQHIDSYSAKNYNDGLEWKFVQG